MTDRYAIFWIDNTEEYASYQYFGQWTGDSPSDVVQRSNIREHRPKATDVYVIEWDGTLFTRGDFAEVRLDDAD